ncbi:Hypothetical Protein sle_64510 [Streptomyces leeuwenhoekii]|uniref:Uncharacterized protein n=1 Tax=Streptomyces leeuwenhoekii TaxID=1437453 RepID=A0A0F7W1P2_STRLW|nr:Hypothetical Protein sle_64510 [Streptomyces leeuwenhoekii]
MSIPDPAITQAMSAPATPVSWANRPGRENTPAPTTEPTTMATRLGSAGLAGADAGRPVSVPAEPMACLSKDRPAPAW